MARRDGKPLELRGHDGPVASCAVSPDGEVLVTGGHDCIVRLWARDGRPLRVLRQHVGWVVAIDSAADGRFVTATGYDWLRSWRPDPGFTDDLARLFDRSGDLACELPGHRLGLTTARFSPDGTHVLTTGNDGAARLWRTPAGERSPTPTSESASAACR